MATILFYFVEMMSRVVANKLLEAGIEVVLAVDVDMMDKDDDTQHLPCAAENELVMVTQDRPFAGRISKRGDHAGLICWIGEQNDFSSQINRLQDFANTYESEAVVGQVFWLK